MVKKKSKKTHDWIKRMVKSGDLPRQKKLKITKKKTKRSR